ncbi:hypothetical protein H4S06_001669 [Coemansia sp. BCRC 34490]|nr:hypothetical protein H4S06_001669 [Coemansia sp. BCRC 34490]
MEARLTTEAIIEDCKHWQSHCFICTMQGLRETNHEMFYCKNDDSQDAKAWMLNVQHKVKYDGFCACFRCGMPQSECPGWNNQSRCAYRGILVPTIAAMVYGPQAGNIKLLWEEQLTEAGVDLSDHIAIGKYLGKVGKPNHSKLFDMYCWLHGMYPMSRE